MKTKGNIENTILYDLTHPTANRRKRAVVNTFSDFSASIYHRATNFAKYLIKTL